MESKDKTCEQRIRSEKESREQTLNEIYAKIESDDYDQNDEGYEELRDLPLEVETFLTIKCLLSTGGPADWLEIELTSYKNSINKITYHFADWFDHAEVVVDEDSPFYRFAEQIIETQLYD